MKIEKCLILCPTYKEAFTLRRALIELGVKCCCFSISNCGSLSTWWDIWNRYKENTVFRIENNFLYFCEKKFYFEDEKKAFFNYKIFISVEEFVKKYIRTYEN